LKILHSLGPELLCRDAGAVADRLHEIFAWYPSHIFPSPGRPFGKKISDVTIVDYAFDNATIFELLQPNDARLVDHLLGRGIEVGWRGISLDIAEADIEDVDRALAAGGIHLLNYTVPHGNLSRGSWTIDPESTDGAMFWLMVRDDPTDNSMFVGTAGRYFAPLNGRVVQRLIGTSVVVRDLRSSRKMYENLGFTFGELRSERNESVLEARLERGTIFQLRSPESADSLAAQYLHSRGSGCFHCIFEASDLASVSRRLTKAEVAFSTEKSGDGRKYLLTDPATTVNVPFEIRATN
jgi:hypothetical protein